MIKDAGLPACFVRTGNFYENMILRKYASYDKDTDVITMSRPIISPKAESKDAHFSTPFVGAGACTDDEHLVVSLYVEKDLSAVCKAVFDLWDTKKSSLNYQILLAAGARETPGDISKIIERGKSRSRPWAEVPK